MKNTTNITCPKCGANIALTEAIEHNIREQLAAEFHQQYLAQQTALAQREATLAAEKQALEEQAKTLKQTVTAQVEAQRVTLAVEYAREAEEKVAVQLVDLRSQVEAQKGKLREAQSAELALLQQKRLLEEERESLKLAVARQIAEERSQIAEKARQQAIEAESLKLAELHLVINGLKEQITALKQRAEQGSMKVQGEALEVTVEQQLSRIFAFDEIVEIKNGERGADVLQRVRTNGALDCGSILWETKRARNWSASWLDKLKEDARKVQAELAVLVTTCLPDTVKGIGHLDGVWVCEQAFVGAVAGLLRQGLIATAVQRGQETNRADKMAQLYRFLCSVEFRQHIEAVVEAFTALQEQVGAERRAFERQWKEREQQLAKALQHTAALYGSIQGITGPAALPQIPSLQLPGAIEEETQAGQPALACV